MKFFKINYGDYININQIKKVRIIKRKNSWNTDVVELEIILTDGTVENLGVYELYMQDIFEDLKQKCDSLGIDIIKELGYQRGFPFPIKED